MHITIYASNFTRVVGSATYTYIAAKDENWNGPLASGSLMQQPKTSLTKMMGLKVGNSRPAMPIFVLK